MTEPLNGGAPLPPRGQLRWFKIVSPANGQSLRAVILGDTFIGKWTHWVPPTVPCAETADCHYCKSGIRPSYNGYIPALVGSPAQRRVLALTYGAACQFTEKLQDRGTLRGLEVTLYRKFKSPRAPVMVRVEREISADDLVESFDVYDSLARQWNVNTDFLRRGCRRIGEDETVAKYIRENMARKASPERPRPYDPGEVG